MRAQSAGSSRTRSLLLNLLCITSLFAINAYVCRDLFTAEFIHQMGSVEGSFIAISRWALQHWGDLTWFPLWFTGMPFLRIYQPGFHVAVAGVAAIFHLTAQHAYHLVNALVYCLQPVTLFWLCYRITGERGYAFVAALVYSLISPAAFLSTVIRDDLGGLWFARRYQTLVHYGEGPHNAALLLIPLAILFLHRFATEKRVAYFPLACLALAAIALSNWPGTIGLTMAVAAYCASRLGGKPPLHWDLLAAAGGTAYLIACRWIPPSVVLSVPANAQQSDGTVLNKTNLLYLGAAVLVLAGLHFALERFQVDRWVRFFLYFALFSGTVSLGNYWFGLSLLPQPHRFHLETEIGLIGAGVYLAWLLYLRCPRWVQLAALVALAAGAALQLRTYRIYAHGQTLPEDITATLEYRMSKWFEANLPGARVFAPGSVSIWMNTFADVPQVVGCCDQGVPTFQHRLAYFTIYTAYNAGDRYVSSSLLWLKAYGAQAIGVGGPHGKEFFKPFARPEAFRGVLPELWRDGDDAIYGVPTRSKSLAHVIERAQMISRPPANGLDTDPLVPYVSALDSVNAPLASFNWINLHQARVDAEVNRSQVLSVQITYDPGWRATVNGVRQPVHSDGIGLMVVEPSCDGPCTVDLVYSGGREERWTKRAQVLGLILCVGWPLAVVWKRRRA